MKGSNNFMKGIDNSGWLENVRKILDCMCASLIGIWLIVATLWYIAVMMGQNPTVDFTSNVDVRPYYRTIRGFSVL